MLTYILLTLISSGISDASLSNYQHKDRHFTPGKPVRYKLHPCDPRYLYTAQLVRVIDGDTFVVLVTLGFKTFRQEIIRLWGIDTPELNRRVQRKRGLKAKKATEDWFKKNTNLKGFFLICTNADDQGKYGRYIADVLTSSSVAGPRTLSKYLIATGNAK